MVAIIGLFSLFLIFVFLVLTAIAFFRKRPKKPYLIGMLCSFVIFVVMFMIPTESTEPSSSESVSNDGTIEVPVPSDSPEEAERKRKNYEDTLKRIAEKDAKEKAKENEPGFIELISYAEHALKDITGEKVSVSTIKDDWDISQTLLRYVMTSDVKIGGKGKNIIIKIEFTDESYTEYKVFQLKIDGINIDLTT